MSTRSTSIPHRTSVSSTTSSHPSQPSQHPSQRSSQTHPHPRVQPPLTAQQLAERVISPSSVLFPPGTAPPSRLQGRRSYTDMERRHPSSFQQLEKVRWVSRLGRNSSRANVSTSWVRERMPQSTKAATDRRANS